MGEKDAAVIGLLIATGLIVHFIYSFSRRPLEPAGPFRATWRPLEAVLITITSYFAAQLFAVGVLYAFQGSGITFREETTEYTFLTVLLFEAFTVLILSSFLRKRRAGLASVGLVRPRLSDPLYALAGYGIYFLSYLALFAVAQELLPQVNFQQEQELGFDTAISGMGLVLVFISLVVLPPIVEEFVCRGFLYSGLRSKLNRISAVLITSIIFAVAHLQFGTGNALLWVAALDTFILSVVLIHLREKTGGLTAPILVHSLKNGVAFTALFIFHVA